MSSGETTVAAGSERTRPVGPACRRNHFVAPGNHGYGAAAGLLKAAIGLCLIRSSDHHIGRDPEEAGLSRSKLASLRDLSANALDGTVELHP